MATIDIFTQKKGSYRSLIVLVVVVMTQLIYLAYQVKTKSDERLIRVWAVSAVTPFSSIFEAVRSHTTGFMKDYFLLVDVREQNKKLLAENSKLKLDNVFYRNQLETAENAKALGIFQARTPSKTVAARVIGDSTVSQAKAVVIDRGSTSNIEKGMAVVTPNGIVGKIAAVYPLAAQVLLVTDSTFKVGVESQRSHIHGVLDCGSGHCQVQQIQNEEDVHPGEWFYTSGEDRVFPRGFPVGTVVSTQPGNGMKDVRLNLSGSPGSVDEVLVVLEGVHQSIPLGAAPEDKVAPPLPKPPTDGRDLTGLPTAGPQTTADKLVQTYEQIGKEQNHVYGAMYSNMPNFANKPQTKPNAAAPLTQANATPQLPVPTPAPSVVPAGPKANAPQAKSPILGAPPAPAPSHPNTATHAPTTKQPLPLGAPRPKDTKAIDANQPR